MQLKNNFAFLCPLCILQPPGDISSQALGDTPDRQTKLSFDQQNHCRSAYKTAVSSVGIATRVTFQSGRLQKRMDPYLKSRGRVTVITGTIHRSLRECQALWFGRVTDQRNITDPGINSRSEHGNYANRDGPAAHTAGLYCRHASFANPSFVQQLGQSKKCTTCLLILRFLS